MGDRCNLEIINFGWSRSAVGLIMNSLTGALRCYVKRSRDDLVLLFSKKYDPLCHGAPFQKEPSVPTKLFSAGLKRNRDRVMIYRWNGTRRDRWRTARNREKWRREWRSGWVERGEAYVHRRHLHFAAGQTEKRTECTRWAMVHMGNECSVANGTCSEQPARISDPLHWPEATRRPWNRLWGRVRICCVRT